MPIFKTFAKRKEEAAKAGKPVIYRYDSLPDGFRAQVFHILRDAICKLAYLDERRDWWCYIHDTLAREIGVLDIMRGQSNASNDGRMQSCLQFLMTSEDIDQVLSLIEISFYFIDTVIRGARHDISYYEIDNSQNPDDAIHELNQRFQDHSIGYQFQGRQIIEVSSQYLHAEAVEPAITLLYEEGFEGALEEFMIAHKHFREGNSEEAITEACKAFESTMKAICDRQGWGYSKGDTASRLLAILYEKQLVPSEMQNHFNGLRTVLESGVSTLRNNFGSHGQGSESRDVPDHYVSYALHLAASNIVFLINSYKHIRMAR